MKKYLILILTLMFVTTVSINKTYSVIKEVSEYKVSVKVPNSKYQKLSSLIDYKINKVVKDFKKIASEENIYHTYTLYIDYKEYKYEDYLSYAFFIETYTGGAHPTHDILTFVFDTRNDKFITANDIFNDENLKKISKYSREKLLKDSRIVDTSMLLEGTKPNIDNFKNFVFSNNLIIIFNEYQIAPYSSGIISLDIPYSIIK